jgi:hypothetical protein
VALIVIAVLAVVGFFVARAVNSLIGRHAVPASPFARSVVRRGVAIGAGTTVFLLGYVLLVGDLSFSTRTIPTFTSLQLHPDASLKGSVAFNALPISSHGKKLGCVDILPASGGPPRQLFCASQPTAMGAALTWLDGGRLQATNRGPDHWRKIVDVRSGVITEVRWMKPPATPAKLGSGPAGEKIDLTTSRGTMHLSLEIGSAKRELLSIAVPPNYSLSNSAWSPDGKWFVVQDSADRLLTVTTGANPVTRLLLDGGTEPAVTGVAY